MGETARMVVTEVRDHDLLASFYLVLKQQGLLEIVFPSSCPSLLETVSWWAKESPIVLGAFERSGDLLQLFGLFWVNSLLPLDEPVADCGFAFTAERSVWLKALALRKALETASSLGITHCYGVIASVNLPAIALAKRVGLQPLAELPGCVKLRDGHQVAATLVYKRLR